MEQQLSMFDNQAPTKSNVGSSDRWYLGKSWEEQVGEFARDIGKRIELPFSPEELARFLVNGQILLDPLTLRNYGLKDSELCTAVALPLEDDLVNIFEALKTAALTHKKGCRTGINFSKLRPTGQNVSSTGGMSSGVIPFLKIFDSATQTVKPPGWHLGSLAAFLSVEHPDVLDFVTAKREHNTLANVKLVLGITEEFIEALKNRESYQLKHPQKGFVRRLDPMRVLELVMATAKSGSAPRLVFTGRSSWWDSQHSIDPAFGWALAPEHYAISLGLNIATFTDSSLAKTMTFLKSFAELLKTSPERKVHIGLTGIVERIKSDGSDERLMKDLRAMKTFFGKDVTLGVPWFDDWFELGQVKSGISWEMGSADLQKKIEDVLEGPVWGNWELGTTASAFELREIIVSGPQIRTLKISGSEKISTNVSSELKEVQSSPALDLGHGSLDQLGFLGKIYQRVTGVLPSFREVNVPFELDEPDPVHFATVPGPVIASWNNVPIRQKAQKTEEPSAVDLLSAGQMSLPGVGAYEAALSKGLCPECGSQMEFSSGCMLCRFCGYSKCS